MSKEETEVGFFDTIKMVIFFLVLTYGSIHFLWKEYDNYIVRQNNILKTFKIEDIENNGIGESRYIEITSAYPFGSYVYQFPKDNINDIHQVIYPVVPLIKVISDNNATKIHVVIVDNTPPHNCVNKGNCVDVNRTTLKGVTMVGFDGLDDKTKELLNSANLNLIQDAVILKLDDKPSNRAEASNIFLIILAIGWLLFSGFAVILWIKNVFFD